MKTLYLAIISIGLILGIGITIMFGILMVPRQPNINITIQGLKDTYEVGERFSFHVKVNGYGSFCGDPAVEIFKTTNRSEIVWAYDRNEFIGICPERDLDDAFGFRNISINQTGSYIVSINNKIEKEFTITPSQPKRIIGLKSDTGMVTLGNQTYYFDTPNYTVTAYDHPVQISFHDVVFTLFPRPFSGGLPTDGCGGSYFWTNAKFPDGTHELLSVFVSSMSCSLNYTKTDLSNHTNPQAGLTVYDGKIRLLVDTSKDQMVTLTGDEAGRVCGVLGIQGCPIRYPELFHAKQIGIDTYLVEIQINDKFYAVTLNDTTACVSSAQYEQSRCYSD